jgi:hypothetical protein
VERSWPFSPAPAAQFVEASAFSATADALEEFDLVEQRAPSEAEIVDELRAG